MKNVPTALPPEGFAKRATVLAIYSISKNTLDRWVQNGRFSAPVRLGPGRIAWDVGDLRRHMERIRRGET